MPKTIDRGLEDRFIAAFEMNEGLALNGSNARLHGLRKEAFEAFSALGFPTKKTEAWKYTNIRRALEHEYQVYLGGDRPSLSPDDLAPFLIPGLDAHRVVLVNGTYSEELSDVGTLPAGTVITSLADANEHHTDLVNRYLGRYAGYEEEPFTALNTAFARDGVFVYVPERTVLDRPLHVIGILQTDEDLFLQPRNLFIFEEGAQARIVESGEALTHTRTFTNSVDEIYVGGRANVDYYRVQREGDDASQVASTHVYQEHDSVFSINTVTLSGALVRNNLNVLPDGEHCESHLIGLFMPRGDEHVDNHTLVDHAKPDCFSNELYKGILDDRASGVFNGKVFVRRDAQRINAFQENKTVVLSDDASINAKPELEIYADDVKCSHGATTGQLDAEALFYLRARGLSEKRARAVLLQAFARDVIDEVKIEPLREMLDDVIARRFTD